MGCPHKKNKGRSPLAIVIIDLKLFVSFIFYYLTGGNHSNTASSLVLVLREGVSRLNFI